MNSQEYERLIKLSKEIKSSNIDTYDTGNYCDALDETKNWCVGEVLNHQDDQLKIHFDGWSHKHDISVFLGKIKKVDHFRKFTKGYTGQKQTAYRTLNFQKEEFTDFKNLVKETKEKKYVNLKDATEITQIIRGKLFYKLDFFMTNPFNNLNHKEMICDIIELIYDYLDLIIIYLNYFKENIFYTEINRKYTELFLVDKNCAFMASIYEILFTLRRIFGKDERVNFFYKVFY